MTAIISYAKTPARASISLHINAPIGAPSTGPSTRTLTIPNNGSTILIGRASTSPQKDRRPADDNALFTCPVMSRSHATISAPNGPYGPIILEDTASMHGVYVNGQKITRTPISASDTITFGNKVTRAEATHDGVSLTVGKIVRDGATFSNAIDLTQNTKTASPALYSKPVPQTSYRVPDYDTDSSKESNSNTTFDQPTAVPYIDLESCSSPARSHRSIYSEDEDDEDDEHAYYNGSDCGSELGSDCEGSDYPENSDVIDDDEQSYPGSDRSGSPCSAAAWDEDDTQGDEAGSEVDEPLESAEENQTAPTYTINTQLAHPEATYPQVEEKQKARGVAETMSLHSILGPTNDWDTCTSTLQPSAGVPSHTGLKETDLLFFPQTQKNNVDVGATNIDKEEVLQNKDASPEGKLVDRELEDLGLMRQIVASQSGANENLALSSSPTGSKRKREIEDDGHEDIPAPPTERKSLKLKLQLTKQNMLRDLLNRSAQTAPRPTKRAKRSTARFALGAVAGAIGGVATVVGVLMTPACEELLSSWPIA